MQGPVLASHRVSRSSLPDVLPPDSAKILSFDPTSADSINPSVQPPLRPANTAMTDHDRHRGGPDRTGKDGGDGEERGQAPERNSARDRVLAALKRHLAFVGPGVVASVAYIDPGNFVTSLQAGSQFGYSHLFIVLFSGLMALLFQILCTRLGCVSSYDLATHCRFALHDRPGRFKLVYRWGMLYPLYAMAEAGIIMTDLAELLGSAIAINLLIPAIPLWACVLLTSLDVFLILLLFNQYPSRTMTTSMRMFELLIGLLVLCVLACFVAMLVKVGPDWGDVFLGYVPSSGIFNNGGIYIAVGIVGATVMPHAFYIGSKMACMQRLKPEDYGEEPDSEEYDSDDYYSDKEDDEDEDLKKKGDASTVGAASARPSRRRGRSTNAPRRDSAPPGVRPYIPFLHLPHPVRLPNVGFDLGKLSRVRTESPDRAPAAVADRGGSTAAEHPSGWKSRHFFAPAATKVRAPTEAATPELGHELDRVPSQSRSAPLDEIADLPAGTGDRGARDLVSGDEAAQAATTAVAAKKPARRGRRPGPSLACVRAHLTHACLDVAGSLLGFALVVNSSILILGAAVFYYGDGQSTSEVGVSDLFDAYDLIKQYLGQALAYVFAIALLAAGQSASLTVTLSGQIVSEGMIRWRTKPWKRRLVTRCIGIIPSLAVAVSVGRHGIDALLVGSQVALSIVLTFVLIPLIIFTSQQSVMAVPVDKNAARLREEEAALRAEVEGPPIEAAEGATGLVVGKRFDLSSLRRIPLRRVLRTLNPIRRRSPPPRGHVSYANSVPVIYLCWALWWIIGIANVYALYQVANP
ncbi:hypothetical protein JCM3774_003382 [Rhodotorula dairenensis]